MIVYILSRGDTIKSFTIGGQKYYFSNCIREDEYKRKLFNNLAYETFGIDMEWWYELGYWTNRYKPYTLYKDGKAVSNVSINLIDFIVESERKKYLQISTVMTDISYRNRGLADFLMNLVLDEWKEKVDSIYLFSNGDASSFYPKYGFYQVKEYQHLTRIQSNFGMTRKLNLDLKRDRELFREIYKASENFGKVDMANNFELLIFNCGNFLKDKIYYNKEIETIIICDQKRNHLLVYGIYSKKSYDDVMNQIFTYSDINNKCVKFGFTPKKSKGNLKIEEFANRELPLFIHEDGENIFGDNRLMFPLLSHT